MLGLLHHALTLLSLGFNDLIIVVQHLLHGLDLKNGSKSLVLPDETNPQQTIPLDVIDLRGWILWLHPDDGRLNFWWRSEIVLSYLHQVVNL